MYCKKCGRLIVGSETICTECLNRNSNTEKKIGENSVSLSLSPNVYTEYGVKWECPECSRLHANDINQCNCGYIRNSSGTKNSQFFHKTALVTNRSLWKMFLLGIITLGIYPTIAQCKMTHKLNIVAYPHDGKITLSPAEAALLFMITLYIYYFVYMRQYTKRLQNELHVRGISYQIGPLHFWMLGVLDGVTLISPLIFAHKMIKAQNLLNDSYNKE